MNSYRVGILENSYWHKGHDAEQACAKALAQHLDETDEIPLVITYVKYGLHEHDEYSNVKYRVDIPKLLIIGSILPDNDIPPAINEWIELMESYLREADQDEKIFMEALLRGTQTLETIKSITW